MPNHIKPEELRIGNLFWFKEPIEPAHIVVSEINKTSVVFDYNNLPLSLSFSQFKPILLTLEWLERFGFEKKPKSEWYKMGSYRVRDFRGVYPFCLRTTGAFLSETCLCEIQYVHQLQNLVYALTAKEL